MTAPTRATDAQTYREFFRSLTLGSPEWVRHMKRKVRNGDQIIRLLAGYLPALPPGLRAAVLAAMVQS
jgi:hypothetical protein